MPVESAYTSRKIIPTAFKVFPFKGINFDLGGGKWDDASIFLKERGCTNLVFDPYNRSIEQNEVSYNKMKDTGVDSISCLNVLNVIQSETERIDLYKNIKIIAETSKKANGKYPIIVFQVYEGDASANKEIQTTMKTSEYIPEITQNFPNHSVKRKGKIVVVYLDEHSETVSDFFYVKVK